MVLFICVFFLVALFILPKIAATLKTRKFLESSSFELSSGTSLPLKPLLSSHKCS